MVDLFSVDDKVVVVTGGLGQLGRQFTKTLAERRARVAVFDLLADERHITDRFGADRSNPNLLFCQVDVTRRESIEAALANLISIWGVPHALINNAALDSPPNATPEENGPFESYSEGSWDKVMDVNVKGVMFCCQVVGGAMAAAGRGSVVNISSIYGLVSPDQRLYEYRRAQGQPFFKPVAYSASKSALYNLTRYLATYWANRNVRVNTLTLAGVFNNQEAEFLKNYTARVPLGRMAREDEYNAAILFLVSEASAYMTGSNMIMDGGWTAW